MINQIERLTKIKQDNAYVSSRTKLTHVCISSPRLFHLAAQWIHINVVMLEILLRSMASVGFHFNSIDMRCSFQITHSVFVIVSTKPQETSKSSKVNNLNKVNICYSIVILGPYF